MTDQTRRFGPALEAAYRFALWLIPAVERFPRSQKFLLGDRMQATMLDVLDGLAAASFSRRSRAVLARVNLLLDRLRIMVRLAHDLRHLDSRRYEHAARSIDEIGRMVGGWMKTGHAVATS